jgi:anaerobic selenocysteine-containing dehydrogenase
MHKRGIANGDRIRIFNDRGEVHIEAKVTPHDTGRGRAGEGAGITRTQAAWIRLAALTC